MVIYSHLFASTRANSIFILVLRGDIARLERCTAITTGASQNKRDIEEEKDDLIEALPKTIKRSKPFKYTYEKEIVMYAYFKVSSALSARDLMTDLD